MQKGGAMEKKRSVGIIVTSIILFLFLLIVWLVDVVILVVAGERLLQKLFKSRVGKNLFPMEHIPLEDAYEDPIVIKWMIARSKMSLARIMGTFNYQLAGNVTINYDQWRQEGKEEWEELKEKVKGDSPADWFLIFN